MANRNMVRVGTGAGIGLRFNLLIVEHGIIRKKRLTRIQRSVVLRVWRPWPPSFG